VATGTIPVALKRLRMEGDLGTPLLCDADKEIASYPELVSHGDTLAGPDLELPLRRHDFCVDTTDPDTSMEAGTVVGLNQVTSDDITGAGTTVVRSLRARETALGPAERPIVKVEEGVLLLKAEPGNVLLCQLHGLGRIMTEICLIGSAVAVVGGSENENVVTTAERVLVECDWTKQNIRIMTGGLVGGRTIEVPVWELAQVGDLMGDGFGFTTKFAMATNPNVFSLDVRSLVETMVGGKKFGAVARRHG